MISPDPVVDVRNLRIVAGDERLVSDVSLSLARGERLGLVGASGAGKSLTASAVAGLLPPAVVAMGNVTVDGTELIDATERDLARVRGRGVTLVAQDSAVALHPLIGVGRQLARVSRRHGGADVTTLLTDVGLPAGAADARPAQLSGGQRQRVALAAALACRPRVLVADEPTAALDPTVARALLDRLDRALDATGAALLLVTHDLGVLTALCARVAVLDAGRVVEQGAVDEVLGAPRHAVTRDLVDGARLSVPVT